MVEKGLLVAFALTASASIGTWWYERQTGAGERLVAAGLTAQTWSLMVKLPLILFMALKEDLRRFRALGQQVGRERGCRPPEPDDLDRVHDYLTSIKLGAHDPNVTNSDIREAWRAILCDE